MPMLLNAHAGTKYGIPFPVLVRSSFGVRGAGERPPAFPEHLYNYRVSDRPESPFGDDPS
jgi:Permease for cytosine/purines, uracil, thiamine, allantoin